MNPSIYLYRETESEFELYLGEFSTLNGLKAINEKLKVQLVSIGASNYKKFGWQQKMSFLIGKPFKK
jgi:hypothetical protein